MNEAMLRAMQQLEAKTPDMNPKRSASFADLTANILKCTATDVNFNLVEGTKTDFSIVAPKID